KADDWDRWHATSPLKNLYCGAAGVLWALDELRRRGHTETTLDLPRLAMWTVERQRERPDFMKGIPLPPERESALLTGETGILLSAFRVAPERDLADDLHRLVQANVANETKELMWGSPGTLLAARLMLDWTGDPRWRYVWDESAQALLDSRDDDGLWTQQLYAHTDRMLGPAHGFVGNLLALSECLDAERRKVLHWEANDILARNAVFEGGLANWPPVDGRQLANARGEIRVQWCHGAPGIVISAAEY